MMGLHEGSGGGADLVEDLGGGRLGFRLPALAVLPGLVAPGLLGAGLTFGLGVAAQLARGEGQDQDGGRGEGAEPAGHASPFFRPPRPEGIINDLMGWT